MTTSASQLPGYVTDTSDIDPVHSHIGFEARHMFVSRARGRFETFEGQIIAAADPLQSSATLTVQMNSVSTGNQTRDDHLRSDNFFAAATYPVMTYQSAGIRRDGRDLVIDGELTIRGVTRPVSLSFEVNGFTADPAEGSTRAGFSASGEVKRMDFGVCSPVPIGGGLAGDKVRIEKPGRCCASNCNGGATRSGPALEWAGLASRFRIAGLPPGLAGGGHHGGAEHSARRPAGRRVRCFTWTIRAVADRMTGSYLLSAFAAGRWIDALRAILFAAAALLALRNSCCRRGRRA